MNLSFFDIDGLEQELKQLSPLHQLAFAAYICERMLPNYNAFSRMESWGDPFVPRKALDEVWQILQGQIVDKAKLVQLREDCGCENIFPDSDVFFDSYYCVEAQEAMIAIRYTMLASLESNSLPSILQVVIGARFNTIELFICERDESFNAREYKDEKDKWDAIPSHPLAVRELSKECEDLQLLKSMITLEPNFIECFRASSKGDGKSIIDVL